MVSYNKANMKNFFLITRCQKMSFIFKDEERRKKEKFNAALRNKAKFLISKTCQV